jgi:hypothetical protein
MVSKGVLKKEQIVPWAPWEIKKSDLESKSIRDIIGNLHKTGKLRTIRDDSPMQQRLFQ